MHDEMQHDLILIEFAAEYLFRLRHKDWIRCLKRRTIVEAVLWLG